MTEGNAWQGNWLVRLYGRVRDLGYTSLTDFAEARPAVPLYMLADELGKVDIAAVQVLRGLRIEAERRNQVTRFVRDVLVREFSESIPGGWPAILDDASRFEIAQALGCWSAYIPESYRERADQVMEALRTTPPPAGWRPLGPDDELLRTLLPDLKA